MLLLKELYVSGLFRLLVVFLCATLHGCGVIGFTYAPFTANEVKSYDGRRIATEDKDDCYSYDAGARSNKQWLVTTDDVITHWGEPHRIETQEGTTKLYYVHSTFWGGVIPVIVFVPIPLVVPAGNVYCIVNVENDLVTGTEILHPGKYQFMCGIYYDFSVSGRWKYGCGDPKVWDR